MTSSVIAFLFAAVANVVVLDDTQRAVISLAQDYGQGFNQPGEIYKGIVGGVASSATHAGQSSVAVEFTKGLGEGAFDTEDGSSCNAAASKICTDSGANPAGQEKQFTVGTVKYCERRCGANIAFVIDIQ